jgi:hypothetical protein
MNQNRMRTATAAAILAAVGLACPALGQDSFGTNSGVHNAVAGDALLAHNTAEQGNAYVVDLTPVVSSWTTEWGIGILAKSSKVGVAPNAFYNTLFSNSAISPDFLVGVDRSSTMYRLWEASDYSLGIAPGVNATGNTSEYVDIAGPADAMQLGWGFSEFGGNENSNVIGGTVAWDTASNPGRLYVNRIVAAVNNSANDVAGSTDQSLGSVDANGNQYIRADRELVSGNQFPSSGLNLLRYDAEARNLTKINWLNQQLIAGTSTATNDVAATNTIAQNYGFNFLPPSNVAESLGRRLITTTSFDLAGDFYFFENPANTPNFQLEDHVDAARTDGLRGSTRVAPLSWFANAVATGAQLIKPQNGAVFPGGTIANAGGETWGVSVWGIDANGDTVAGSQRTYVLPHAFSVPGAPIVDNAPGASGLDPATGLPYVVPNVAEFDNYRGTAAFRGPASQVAISEDLGGNRYVAAVVYNPPQIGLRFAPGNAVVVGRISTGTSPGTVTWSVAAWNNYDQSLAGVSGKPILDGPGGNVIGRMVAYEIAETLNLRGGFSTGSVGPSISSPGFDSAGNVYFVTTVQLQRGANFDDFFTPQPPLVDDGNGNIVVPNPERDIYELALVRAVLNPGTFTYDLELVARTGQVFSGGNTGVDYMLESMSLVNNNNAGPSPAQFDSGNISLASRNDSTPANNASADTLGGLIVSAKIIYDLDGLDTINETNSADGLGFAVDYPVALGGNGPFEDLSLGLTPFFPASEDQAYNAILFIGNQPSVVPTGACCVDLSICSEGTEFDCAQLGGVYQGDGVTCASNPCQPVDPTGACCFACTGGAPVPNCPNPTGPAIGCQELTAAQCAAAGGLYVGDNSTCTQGIGGPCDCAGDINNDGNCNAADFTILAGSFGQGNPNCRTHAQGDLNCDGIVNAADFTILAGNFGCIRN